MSFRFRIQTCFPPKKSVSPPKNRMYSKVYPECIPMYPGSQTPSREYTQNTPGYMLDTYFLYPDNKPHHI